MQLFSPAQHDATLVLGTLSPLEERAILRANPKSRCWRRMLSVDGCVRELQASKVQRVLLLQSRPNELPRDTPARLRTAQPDIQLLSVAGAWCEGELRTGSPWPDVERVYWRQLLAAASHGERHDRRLTLVNARDYDSGRLWADVLEHVGHSSAWTRRGEAEPLVRGATLAIWDGDQLDGLEANQLAVFCAKRRLTATPVIAVFDFPRADMVQAAMHLGVSAVLSRPWKIEELSSTIDSVRPKHSSRPVRILPPAAARKAA